ncbi:jg14756 [Pararge aegeria aegeria]|uniref:Jg14756 protein n=1 Tax=Pararge aegeria aegeria TaxID=348720 RepID=A0A8S4SJ70_9NEOP|nr:jg14756 [Pararge aegeria aegeria]
MELILQSDPDPADQVRRQAQGKKKMKKKSHMPVVTPVTTPFRPEHSIATMLLSGRNKHLLVVLLRASSVTKNSTTS